MTEKLLEKSLDIFTKEILPITEKGVSEGNKIFGAAILKKKDLSLVVAGSNNETENPIWHGETYTLKKFYEISNKGEGSGSISIGTPLPQLSRPLPKGHRISMEQPPKEPPRIWGAHHSSIVRRHTKFV